jgi:hypothetical protein
MKTLESRYSLQAQTWAEAEQHITDCISDFRYRQAERWQLSLVTVQLGASLTALAQAEPAAVARLNTWFKAEGLRWQLQGNAANSQMILQAKQII